MMGQQFVIFFINQKRKFKTTFFLLSEIVKNHIMWHLEAKVKKNLEVKLQCSKCKIVEKMFLNL